MNGGNILYPNVTRLPDQSGVGPAERAPRKPDGKPGEFDDVFEKSINSIPGSAPGQAAGAIGGSPNLNQVRDPLKFSAHATQRLRERNIKLDQPTLDKVNVALDKAEAKGVDDTLVLTKDAALIVSVKNRTVITAMDRKSLDGNVFTNIDGAVIV